MTIRITPMSSRRTFINMCNLNTRSRCQIETCRSNTNINIHRIISQQSLCKIMR